MTIVESLDNKPISTKQKKQLNALRAHSIVTDGTIVVPIMKSSISDQEQFNKKNFYNYHTGCPFHPIARLQAFETFSFDLAFSMTVHKAQGRTISRVVVDLNSCPMHYLQMEFPSIFVSMSRVENREHLRRLGHKKNQNPIQTYGYVTKLRPSIHVKSFYAGYNEKESYLTLAEENISSYVWEGKKALDFKDDDTL